MFVAHADPDQESHGLADQLECLTRDTPSAPGDSEPAPSPKPAKKPKPPKKTAASKKKVALAPSPKPAVAGDELVFEGRVRYTIPAGAPVEMEGTNAGMAIRLSMGGPLKFHIFFRSPLNEMTLAKPKVVDGILRVVRDARHGFPSLITLKERNVRPEYLVELFKSLDEEPAGTVLHEYVKRGHFLVGHLPDRKR
jgi:hypothetical protein